MCVCVCVCVVYVRMCVFVRVCVRVERGERERERERGGDLRHAQRKFVDVFAADLIGVKRRWVDTGLCNSSKIMTMKINDERDRSAAHTIAVAAMLLLLLTRAA